MFGTRPPLTARQVTAFVIALVAAAPITAHAQQGELPPADSIVARHVAAIGGEAAVRSHDAMKATGTMEVPAAGIKGALTIVAAAPDKQSMTVVIPGLGEIVSGYDGTNAWSMSPMQGAKLLEGKELEDMRAEAGFHAGQLRAHPGIASRRTVEQTEMNGESCYRVEVSWTSGRESWECYSAASGLLIAAGGKRETENGTLEIVNLIDDYREVGGIKYAMRARQQLMGMEQVFQFETVEFVDVDPAAFVPPAQIQSLIQARSGS